VNGLGEGHTTRRGDGKYGDRDTGNVELGEGREEDEVKKGREVPALHSP